MEEEEQILLRLNKMNIIDNIKTVVYRVPTFGLAI